MSQPGPAPTQPSQGELNPKRWVILGVLVVSLLVVVLDNTVLNVALPTIGRDLGATQEQLVWSINSYTCVFAAMLFTWGVLGDRDGRKRILMIGLTLFGLASLLTAYAQTPEQLIVFRGIMGFGGASVLPVTLAIITVVFPPHERGKAIGMWAAAVGAAVAIGPVLGGFLIEHFWWGSVFLINVPIVVVGVILIAMLVPESKNPKPGRLDPLGVVLSVTGLLLLTYGILHGGDTREWGSVRVLGPTLVGLLLIVSFVLIEWRSDHPSLDLTLFKIRSFTVSLTAVTLAFAAMTGTLIFLTFYLQVVR
ncbi:MAG TPA: MFS transporter, partial [Candidatus Limnocylindria bacterium]|nr:MFS transporter [Candidatus Limnocylindria bacterium]